MRQKCLICLVLSIVLVLTGCGGQKEKEEQAKTYVYYLNSDGDKIEAVDYVIPSGSKKEQVKILLKQLQKNPGEGMQTALPRSVVLRSTKFEENQLTLSFNEKYKEMDRSREILARAAIVRTLLQVMDIDFVSFFVGEAPLKDYKGNFVGAMSMDSFVENVGQKINSISEQTGTLYYASKNGKKLVPVDKTFYILANESSEKTIIKQLMESGKAGEYKSAIPKGTKLISVSTVDGVCFVVFDEAFMEQDYSVKEDVVIYSIVNSLCEMKTINKVQISVKGESGKVYREKFSLDDTYERNLDLVEKKKK